MPARWVSPELKPEGGCCFASLLLNVFVGLSLLQVPAAAFVARLRTDFISGRLQLSHCTGAVPGQTCQLSIDGVVASASTSTPSVDASPASLRPTARTIVPTTVTPAAGQTLPTARTMVPTILAPWQSTADPVSVPTKLSSSIPEPSSSADVLASSPAGSAPKSDSTLPLGLGLGIGGAAILLLGGVLLYCHRKRSKGEGSPPGLGEEALPAPVVASRGYTGPPPLPETNDARQPPWSSCSSPMEPSASGAQPLSLQHGPPLPASPVELSEVTLPVGLGSLGYDHAHGLAAALPATVAVAQRIPATPDEVLPHLPAKGWPSPDSADALITHAGSPSNAVVHLDLSLAQQSPAAATEQLETGADAARTGCQQVDGGTAAANPPGTIMASTLVLPGAYSGVRIARVVLAESLLSGSDAGGTPSQRTGKGQFVLLDTPPACSGDHFVLLDATVAETYSPLPTQPSIDGGGKSDMLAAIAGAAIEGVSGAGSRRGSLDVVTGAGSRRGSLDVVTGAGSRRGSADVQPARM